MGQKPSSTVCSVDIDRRPKHRRKFCKSFKAILKAGLFSPMRRKNFPRPPSACMNATRPNTCLMGPSLLQEEPDKRSKHSLLSYALSKLAVFSESSKSRLKAREDARQLTFNKFRRVDNRVEEEPPLSPPTPPTALSDEIENSKSTSLRASNNNDAPMKEESKTITKRLSLRETNKKESKSVAKILSSREAKKEKSKSITKMPSPRETKKAESKSNTKIPSPRETKKKESKSVAKILSSRETKKEESKSITKMPSPRETKKAESKSITKVPSPRVAKKEENLDEKYRRNLEKFEKILACNALTSSDEELTDYFNRKNNNIVGNKKATSGKPSRVIATSKNRVEVDSQFASLLRKLRSSMSKKNGNNRGEVPGTKRMRIPSSNTSDVKIVGLGFFSKIGHKGNDSNNNASKKSIMKGSRAPATNSKSKGSVRSGGYHGQPIPQQYRTPPRSPQRSRGPSPKARYMNPRKKPKSHSCAGKGCFPTAPPAYLDYGGASGGTRGKMRPARDVVMERIKNVDVVEELTYMVPNDCGKGDGECEEEEDCDYYALCESCGEMEPIPEGIRRKMKGNDAKGKSETPVTYSRRQRFNFNQRGDEDDDGPPYPYEGLQCPSCRCTCCVAGLRRNPHCNCKCCQTMGNARRCSSFDEFPVGKNPQIRRVLCPEEECKLVREECDKRVPADSGMYKYDDEKGTFVRQVPRTPTPIMIDVPKPRPLRQHEIETIAQGLLHGPGNQICEAEPMYLPPIFGQCNSYPPCCAPRQDGNAEPKPVAKSAAVTGTHSSSSSAEKSSSS